METILSLGIEIADALEVAHFPIHCDAGPTATSSPSTPKKPSILFVQPDSRREHSFSTLTHQCSNLFSSLIYQWMFLANALLLSGLVYHYCSRSVSARQQCTNVLRLLPTALGLFSNEMETSCRNWITPTGTSAGRVRRKGLRVQSGWLRG
jgi:hypothetical protein